MFSLILSLCRWLSVQCVISVWLWYVAFFEILCCNQCNGLLLPLSPSPTYGLAKRRVDLFFGTTIQRQIFEKTKSWLFPSDGHINCGVKKMSRYAEKFDWRMLNHLFFLWKEIRVRWSIAMIMIKYELSRKWDLRK